MLRKNEGQDERGTFGGARETFEVTRERCEDEAEINEVARQKNWHPENVDRRAVISERTMWWLLFLLLID